MGRGSEKQKVVVIGGQFAGRRASRLLRRNGDLQVTLLDSKGFWEYTPGALRCLVEPAAARHMVLAQPRGTVRATAVGLETAGSDTTVTGVKLNDGSSLPADYVVVATGSAYPDARPRARVSALVPNAVGASRFGHGVVLDVKAAAGSRFVSLRRAWWGPPRGPRAIAVGPKTTHIHVTN